MLNRCIVRLKIMNLLFVLGPILSIGPALSCRSNEAVLWWRYLSFFLYFSCLSVGLFVCWFYSLSLWPMRKFSISHYCLYTSERSERDRERGRSIWWPCTTTTTTRLFLRLRSKYLPSWLSSSSFWMQRRRYCLTARLNFSLCALSTGSVQTSWRLAAWRTMSKTVSTTSRFFFCFVCFIFDDASLVVMRLGDVTTWRARNWR